MSLSTRHGGEVVTNPLKHALVRSIMGDIREVFTVDPDEIDDDDIELTDEEIAEFDALPDAELSPEQTQWMVARGMELFNYILYEQEMKRRGLPHVDRWEWMNMAVKPELLNE